MSERQQPDTKGGDAPERERTDEPFLRRWSRLKADRKAAAVPQAPPPPPEESAADLSAKGEEPEPLPPGDEDMPPIESLDADSDFSGFMSPRVSAVLRKQALRKLFRSAKFNVISDLDDYIDDYRNFPALGDIVTADMKHAAARLLEKQLAAAEADSGAAGGVEAVDAVADGKEPAALAASADDHAPADDDSDDNRDSDDSEERARDA